jgi:hypothetical protein
MYLRLSSAILLCLCFQLSYAQKNKSRDEPPDNDNLKMYLDDGRIGNVMNMIRFRFGPTLSGYMGLSYERKFNRKFGLEVGGYYKAINSLVWNENARLAFALENASFGITKTKGGFGITAYPKYYMTGKSLNNGYFLGVRGAAYAYNAGVSGGNYVGDQIVPGKSLSAVLMIGSHQQWGSRFAFGLEWGFGVAKETYKGVESGEYNYINSTVITTKRDIKATNFILSLDMIFGFLF